MSMSDIDKLREHAATIMCRLEDAHFAAMNIQGRDQSLDDIKNGFETIRAELIAIKNLLLKTDVLMTSLKTK